MGRLWNVRIKGAQVAFVSYEIGNRLERRNSSRMGNAKSACALISIFSVDFLPPLPYSYLRNRVHGGAEAPCETPDCDSAFGVESSETRDMKCCSYAGLLWGRRASLEDHEMAMVRRTPRSVVACAADRTRSQLSPFQSILIYSPSGLPAETYTLLFRLLLRKCAL